MRDDPCPACGATLQLVWVHGHGQCANCCTNVVACCMGAGQEADERAGDPCDVSVNDVVGAFARCANGSGSITVDALRHAITEHEECTYDAANAAIDRAVALRRLALNGKVVRLQE